MLIGKLIKNGVWGRWDEVESFKDRTLVNEFLFTWPFLKGIVDGMTYERRMSFNEMVTRGTSSVVLRKLVKDFGLSGYKYPINTNTAKPALIISEHLDDSKAEGLEKNS